MSRNYSASQYEKSFAPKCLQNYQVPRDPQPGLVSNQFRKREKKHTYI